MLRILVLTPCIPVPPNTGGKLRSYHIIRGLAKRNRLAVISFVGGNARDGQFHNPTEVPGRVEWTVCPIGSGMIFKQLASPFYADPFIVQHYKSERMRRTIRETLNGQEWDLLYVDTLPMSPYAHLTDVPAVLDLRDMFTRYHQTARDLSSSPIATLYHAIQQNKHMKFVLHSLQRFDRVLVCSENDAQRLKELLPDAAVHVVPNGVDSNYFRPTGTAVEPKSLVFLGSMDYFPNVDGLLSFVEHVFPEVLRRHPEVRLYVVGRNPTRLVRGLHDGRRIVVTGEVEDIRPYVAKASVSICPTRIQTGTQIKILETMSMGKPVVCTPQASVGSKSSLPGLFVAPDDKMFTEIISRLLSDPPGTLSIGSAGRRAVAQRYQWSHIVDSTQGLLEQVAS